VNRSNADCGTAAAELVLLIPALVVSACFVFWCGRQGQGRTRVDLAASAGARAASLVSRVRMYEVGREAALASLSGNGVACRAAQIDVSSDVYAVRVTVRCTTNSAELAPFGERTIESSATSVIDELRVG